VAVVAVRGIGRQYAQRLYAAGITTAAGLAGCSEAFARKRLGGVVGARLVRELRGFPCQGLAPSEDGTLSRRSLCCSRTFGRPLSEFPDIAASNREILAALTEPNQRLAALEQRQ
jgi:DNA polymerase V